MKTPHHPFWKWLKYFQEPSQDGPMNLKNEHNRVIHWSSSSNLTPDDVNYAIKKLNAFRWSAMDPPSSILREYNFFLRNNLFTKHLAWYTNPIHVHKLFAVFSSRMFRRIESARHSLMRPLAFQSLKSQYVWDIFLGLNQVKFPPIDHNLQETLPSWVSTTQNYGHSISLPPFFYMMN